MIAVFAIPECWLWRREGGGFLQLSSTTESALVIFEVGSRYSPLPSNGIVASCGEGLLLSMKGLLYDWISDFAKGCKRAVEGESARCPPVEGSWMDGQRVEIAEIALGI